MMMRALTSLLIVGLLAARLSGAELPNFNTIPAGLGVNIHFTHPKSGELEQLAAAGFKIVRMDFTWSATEKDDGSYDFSKYDFLLDQLDKHRIRALFILDYRHHKYDDNQAPHTDKGRAAFTKWAIAGATRFKNRGVIWEMYNEPNGQFWHPQPNADDFARLALSVGKAFREKLPNEIHVGPATSGVDLPFLETCFKAGLLEYWSAVTVHPYRNTPPETAAGQYRELRLMIARYAPKGKTIPILSGEWGYSSIWAGLNPELQGKYLSRQWLTNIMNDVPLSIWYDWHDDGPDEKEPEHHFGTVDLSYKPKPAYLAAKELVDELRGYTFNKRLMLDSSDDYLLLFTNDDSVKAVVWTTSETSHEVELPANLGKHTLTDTPAYITPSAKSKALTAAVKWERAPLEILVHAPGKISGSDEILTRGQTERALPRTLESHGLTFRQESRAVVLNPLTLTPQGLNDSKLLFRLNNPSGEPFAGTIAITQGSRDLPTVPVKLEKGRTELTLACAAPGENFAHPFNVVLVDHTGAGVGEIPALRVASVEGFEKADGYRIKADGDAKVASDSAFSSAVARAPLLGATTTASLKLDYNFQQDGWKFLMIKPAGKAQAAIEGKPTALGMWVFGDGSGNHARLRFRDSKKQTHQADSESIRFKGWKYITFPMDRSNGTSWGGPADGKIHYPIEWEAIFLFDNATRKPNSGTIYLAKPTLIYDR